MTTDELLSRYHSGEISRQSFVRRAMAAGLSLTAIAALLDVEAHSSGVASAASRAGASGDLATLAIQAASAYKGSSITLTYEASLQAQGPLTMIPQWEQATGTKVNLVQLPNADLYNKPVSAHLASTYQYDLISIQPSWIPDLVNEGVIVTDLAPYLNKYGIAEAQAAADYPAYYWKLQQWNGKRVGIMTDGDVFVLYYRQDWFSDPANKAAFKQQHGYTLAPPTTWKQFGEIAKFFTDRGNSKVWGAGEQRAAGQVFEFYLQRFGAYGGRYFDPSTMKATINSSAGVRALADMVEQNKYMPPGVAKWDFVAALTGFLQGQTAMLMTWPPVGKWANGYGLKQKLLSWIPPTKVVGKIGYAVPPGGHPQYAGGLMLCVDSDARQKDLAYLFAQWYTSPPVELQWIPLTYALGKPTRNSQYSNAMLRTIFPTAGQWLDVLKAGASAPPHPDIEIPGGKEYNDAVDQACTAAFAGMDPKAALDACAAKWNATTQRLGVTHQKAAYQSFLKPLEDASLGSR